MIKKSVPIWNRLKQFVSKKFEMTSPYNSPPSQVIPPNKFAEYYKSNAERQAFIREHFDHTAPHYNWISQLLSFGSGKWYRRDALKKAGLSQGMKVLDIACGPGTLTCHALKIVGDKGIVVGLDPSIGMLREAAAHTSALCIQGISERLPFPDNTFDFVCMGYALRHVSDLRVAFREHGRVLKSGGALLILEISRPHSKVQFTMTKFYMKTLVPFLTRMGTRNNHAHKLMSYFWETIEHCVPPDQIIEAMKSVGLASVNMSEMGGGLIKDYHAIKP